MNQLKWNDFKEKSKHIYLNRVIEPCNQPQHSHDFIEIEYVLSGIGTHFLGQAEIAVSPGDIFFTNCDTPHCFCSESEKNPIIVYNCLFAPERLEHTGIDFSRFSVLASDLLYREIFPEEYRQMPYIRVYDTSRRIRRVFEDMYEEFCCAEEGCTDMLLGGLIQLLTLFLRLYKQNISVPVKRAQDRYLTEVLTYIESNYSGQITLGELSKIALLSPNHLCKVFKESTGTTISEYIQRLRLEKVCELLRTTERTLSDISAEVGYRDESFLRRLFKKEFNCTPSDYRKPKQI